MKKMLMCMACMLLVCAGAVAQNRQGGRNRGNHQARMFQPLAVIDTAIINHIGLSEEMLKEVYTLQSDQEEEAKKAMEGMMPERGKRMSEDAMKGMQEKMTATKSEFRGQLRNLIGDEMYITYLEKSLDMRGMFGGRNMQMGGGMQRGNGDWGGQGNQGGFGGGVPGGGFGGGDFPGGGF